MSSEIETVPFEDCERHSELHMENWKAKSQPLWIGFFDISLALIGMLFTLIPMLIIAIAIKLDSRGPVFFIQERLGQYKRPIRLIKFRTMRVDAEEDSPTWAKENDSRVTLVGRFLRKKRLDEIPQLFNVLKGDLSFVGPRPIRKYFADLLQREDPYYDKRFLVKPGVTGWAQIYTSYARTIEQQLNRLQYDLRYLNGIAVRDYVRIILLTVMNIIKGKGE